MKQIEDATLALRPLHRMNDAAQCGRFLDELHFPRKPELPSVPIRKNLHLNERSVTKFLQCQIGHVIMDGYGAMPSVRKIPRCKSIDSVGVALPSFGPAMQTERLDEIHGFSAVAKVSKFRRSCQVSQFARS